MDVSSNQFPSSFLCIECDRTFSAKRNLDRHNRRYHHAQISDRPSVTCSLCFGKCHSMSDYQKHIEIYHPHVPLSTEDKVFYCDDDFMLWKKSIEKDTNASFVKRRGSKKLSDGRIATYYFCHRSGNIQLKRDRVRRLKSMGSNKLGCACPAHIFCFKDTFEEAVQIEVKFLSTHVGHECEPLRMPLSRAERRKLATTVEKSMHTAELDSPLIEEMANSILRPSNQNMKFQSELELIHQENTQYQEYLTIQPEQLIQLQMAEVRSSSSMLEFFMMIGKLKHLKRTGWVMRGITDCETVSGHMHRMGLMAFLLEDGIPAGLNRDRCIKMAIVHDIAECIVGDLTPFCGVSKEEKHLKEMEAMKRLCSLIGERVGEEILSLFTEFEEQLTPEAKAVKDLDKFDMILQAYEYEKQYNNSVDLQNFFSSTEGTFEHPKVIEWVQELMHMRSKSPEPADSQLFMGTESLLYQP